MKVRFIGDADENVETVVEFFYNRAKNRLVESFGQEYDQCTFKFGQDGKLKEVVIFTGGAKRILSKDDILAIKAARLHFGVDLTAMELQGSLSVDSIMAAAVKNEAGVQLRFRQVQ